MLDLKLIRQEPDRVRAALKAKRSAVDLDRLLHLDAERRDLLAEVETLKAERNTVSRRIGEMKQRGDAGGVDAEMRHLFNVLASRGG
jgi:seryl-tRNA synthetase